MAIRVRMGFSSLIDVFFVMIMILVFIIDSIPHYMKYYADQPRWLGLFLGFWFCVFLWRLGNMMFTFVQTYLHMRDLHATIVIMAKDAHRAITLGGQLGSSDND